MTSKTTNKFSAEVCARAVRMVLDHETQFELFEATTNYLWLTQSLFRHPRGCLVVRLH
jgi:hypothetical protein